MRLSISSGISPMKSVTKKDLAFFKDIGFRVVGGGIDLEATDDDIKRFNDLMKEMDLEVGEIHVGESAMVGPDENVLREYRKKIIRGLEIGGKIQASHIQFSIGSMHPDNIWIHHPENHTQKALDMLVRNAR